MEKEVSSVVEAVRSNPVFQLQILEADAYRKDKLLAGDKGKVKLLPQKQRAGDRGKVELLPQNN